MNEMAEAVSMVFKRTHKKAYKEIQPLIDVGYFTGKITYPSTGREKTKHTDIQIPIFQEKTCRHFR